MNQNSFGRRCPTDYDIDNLVQRLEEYSQDLVAYKLGCDFADACQEAIRTIRWFQEEYRRLRQDRDSIAT